VPAVESLKAVMTDIRAEQPEVFAALGSAGMLCARHVRNKPAAISNHAWGAAIDLTLNNELDGPGNNRVQAGLTLVAPIFNRHRWFWGAGFGKEDAMHFELSDQKIRELHAAGVFGTTGTPPTVGTLSIGDRGQAVKRLQEKLNGQGADLTADGVFGPGTRSAVVAFQAAHGLTPDGLVGAATRAALGLDAATAATA
jgi:hypothetical protein